MRGLMLSVIAVASSRETLGFITGPSIGVRTPPIAPHRSFASPWGGRPLCGPCSLRTSHARRFPLDMGVDKVPGDGQGPVQVPIPGTGGMVRVLPPGHEGGEGGGATFEGESRDVMLGSTVGWGDGHHPTTYLSLEFLAERIQGGEQVLDYGTGSGVLGMAAHRLGSGRVVGIDIDDEALDAAYENLELNHISDDAVTLRHTREVVQDSTGIILRDDAAGQSLQFDIVVANILIGPLMKLAPILSMAVREDGGVLCLCGLREEQLPDIRACYARWGVSFDDSVRLMEHTQWRPGAEGEGVWARLVGRRRRLTDEERKSNIQWWNEQAVT